MIKKILSFLITFLIPFYLVRFNVVAPTTLFEVFILIVFIYLLLSSSAGLYLKLKQINGYVLVGSTLFLIGSLIGLFSAPDKLVALGQIKGFIVVPILAALSLIMLGRKYEVNAKLGLYFSTFLIGLESIGEYFLHIRTIDGRVLGVYRLDAGASPNYLSLYLTPIAVLLLHDLFRQKFNYKKVIGIIVFIVLFISIILSQSRAGIGVVIIALIYECYLLLINKYDRLKVNIATAIIGLIVLMGIIFISLPHFTGPSHYSRVSTSNNIRYIIWKTTFVKIIPQHWLLGVGLGNYQHTFSQTNLHDINFSRYVAPLAVTPHNVFLSVWLDLGLIGLVGFILILVGFFKANLLKTGWAVSLLALILIGLVDTPIFKNDLGSYFWILILAGSYWASVKREIE